MNVMFSLPNASQVTFCFDLGSPYAYLAAERLPSLSAEPITWQPLLLGGQVGLDRREADAAATIRRSSGRQREDSVDDESDRA